jgi:excisionase family DNA binding protein
MSQKISCEKNTSEAFKSEKFWTVSEASLFLSVKPSTIYQWVHLKKIPHYKIGRIIRFKRRDLEAWVEEFRKERVDEKRKAKEILRAICRETPDIDLIIEKSIEEVRGLNYTFGNGRPDRIKSLRREGENGPI